MTAGFQDAPRLLIPRNPVRKKHRAELAGHGIKALIAERQRKSISLFPRDPTVAGQPRLCVVKHRLIEIRHGNTRGRRKPRGDGSRQNARPGGCFQQIPWRRFRQPVCKIVGITYRQLDYWARTDLVRPSICDANGSGTQRLYSYRDLVELKVVKRLLDADISLQAARKAIEYLREQLGTDLASAHLVLDGTHTVLVETGDQIVDLLRNGQGVLNIVPLGRVVTDLEHELDNVEPDERVAVGDASPPRAVAR